ncbi:hemolysin III family protein [Variovorax sp.]|jgi:hemolysin III|uniref:PAQR family membrane homeostasis protein TrhA n=1 Tax=Variovorax sp. TaxID=1871043 RepID=UPI001AC4CB82|nr:hemolysin III family protein [Burkholderiales bacterium]
MYPGERFNGLSHLMGLIFALLGAVWLLAKTWPTDDPLRLVGALVFSASVIVLYAASTLFHSTRGPMKAFWQRIDHGAIYLLIAGTVTPFALGSGNSPTDGWQLIALCAIWSLAGMGVVHALRSPAMDAPPLWLYIGMGWIGVAAALRGSTHLAPAGLALLLAGAVLYTAGTVFYRNRRGFRHAHGTWHMFVLSGTTSHYLAIGAFVL